MVDVLQPGGWIDVLQSRGGGLTYCNPRESGGDVVRIDVLQSGKGGDSEGEG